MTSPTIATRCRRNRCQTPVRLRGAALAKARAVVDAGVIPPCVVSDALLMDIPRLSSR